MNVKLLFLGLLILLFTSQAYAILTDDLVSYYKLDETSGTLVIDATGNSNGTYQGTYTLGNEGIINNSFTSQNADNSNNRINLANRFNGLTKWSISMWAKATANTLATTDAGLYWNNNAKNNCYIRSAYLTCDFGSATSTNTNYNWNDYDWHHVVVTKNGTAVKVYVDGTNTYSGSFTYTIGDYNMYFGTWNYHSFRDGKIDEIGLWSRALTSDEITKLYNSGSGLTYPFDTNTITADFDYVVDELDVDLNDTSRVVGDAVIDSWEWLIDDVSVSTDQNYSFTGTEYTDYNVCLTIQDTTLSLEDSICQTISIGDITPPTTTFSSFQVPNTTTQSITLTCTDNNTGCKYTTYNINNEGWITQTQDVNFFTTGYQLENNLDTYYNMDDATGEAIDQKEYDNNGTLTNISTITGLYNDAYEFNGSSSYISMGSDPIQQGQDTNFTVSVWVYITANPASLEYIYDSKVNDLYLGIDSSGRPEFRFYDNSVVVQQHGSALNLNEWNHVVFMYDNGTSIKIYQNGLNTLNYNTTRNPRNMNNPHASIGSNRGGDGGWFDGYLDEIAFWDGAIAKSDINELYNQGAGITFGKGLETYDLNFSIIYSGAGSHTIQYFSTDNSDNNETIKTSNFTTYGNARFNFKDENTYTPVTTTYTINPSINGISTGSATSLDLNLQGITNQLYGFQFSAAGYGTRFYYTDLNEFSALDFNQLMLQDANAANNITLKIYNATGEAIVAGTPVTITKANYLVGKYLTNGDGAITPFLADLDTNYVFNVEGNYTTSQRPVLVYRPKYDSNFGNITGNWQITLTGPNSTNRYTITTNSQVIAILPNTETLYSAKVCMLSGSVCSTSFFSRTYLLGFKGLVGESSIQPYLNLVADSTLRTLKVLDYTTNQPYPLAKIVITSKTDLGLTYIVESLYTDSTGTAGVYLTDGQTYTITANDLTVYTIIPNAETPTYYVYFNFLVLPTETIPGLDVNTYNDFNGAEFFVMRNTLFSCTGTSDCFPSALIAIVLTMIILVVATAVTVGNFIGVKGLSLIAFICFTIFFGIGWLPVYIFAFLGSITLLLLVVVQ